MPEDPVIADTRVKPDDQIKPGAKRHKAEPRLGVRYRALVEQVPAIIYTDSAVKMLQTLYISPQLKTLTGYDPEEWINDDHLWENMIYPEDRERILKVYVESYQSLQPSITEYRLVARDGRVVWVSDETRLVRDRRGKPLFWQGVMVDITARKRAEQVQQALYLISHAVVTTTGLDELFRSIHLTLGELMPVMNLYIALYDEEEDLISYPYYVDEYDSPPQPAKPEHGLTEYVLRTQKPLWAPGDVFTRLVLDGEADVIGTDSVDWIGVPLAVGERVIGVMVTQSYTPGVLFNQEHFDLMQFVSAQVATAIERKLDQQRINDALEYNRTLINTSSLGIGTYDASGQCILANEAFARMIGATREQVLCQNYNQIDSWRESGLLESAEEAVVSGKETRREVHMITTFGKDVWLDCRFTPFYSNAEPQLLLSIDDITLAKQAENNLKVYAEKLEQSNRDLQEFAYIASHDLQEPLRKVLAFSDRLANKYGNVLDETGFDYLKRMREASQRMQTLINDLLTFSRVSTRAQPFEKADLNEIIKDVVSDLEHQIERTHGNVIIEDLPVIEADPTQMHQLLQNLVNNGLKFHTQDEYPEIEITSSTARGKCHIFVKDNGIGFELQYLDRIFKPFQRLHSRQEYEGSGMGLAICRRIVERHSGEITATSTPGKGSTFIITLPIHQINGENSYG